MGGCLSETLGVWVSSGYSLKQKNTQKPLGLSMKTIITRVFLTILMTTLFAGCGGGGSTSDSNAILGNTTTPVITVTGDNPMTISKGSAFSDPGAVATSSTDSSLDVTSTGLVDTLTPGTYEITYTTRDSAGNEVSITRTVIVENSDGTVTPTPATPVVSGDVTAPVITLLGDNPVTINQNTQYVDAGATATDNEDASVSVSSTASSINTEVVGVYTIRYYATDAAGNTATTTRTVNVSDAVAPVITLLGDNPVTLIQGSPYTDAGATASDDIDDSVNVSVVNNVDTATVGSYSVIYTATDLTGNTTTAIRNVTIIERGITGNIYDYTTGLGITGVTVATGSQRAASGHEGVYTIATAGAFPLRTVVNFSADGFAPTSKIALTGETDETRVLLNVNMFPVEFTGTYNPALGFTVDVPDSAANITISANSLITSNGETPAPGTIRAELTPIDPAQSIDLMPGDMTINTGLPISSYGAITVVLTDSAGQTLDLAPGSTATIRIPVSNKGTETPPSSIALFYYDESTGFWVQEGTASLVNGNYYEGSISRFGSWNAGTLFETISIRGCVEDANANRVANVHVKMEGFDYSSTQSTLTDDGGNYILFAKKDSTTLVSASTASRVSNTQIVGDDESTSSDVNLTECLKLGNDQISVRLTWGQNPSDLDTHLIGPNGYHVWYADKGSLSTAPFAQLDVDDVSSFGPEVLTVLNFPGAGVYHYAVHHFAGSSTISGSPARVELTLDGRRTVFVPPRRQGNADKWWNVFDLVVDDNGDVSFVLINTWSQSSPRPAGDSTKQERIIFPAKSVK